MIMVKLRLSPQTSSSSKSSHGALLSCTILMEMLSR